LLVFSSDNGFAPYVLPKYNVERLGHFPSYLFRGYKSDIWEGGHHVPMIVRWPGSVRPGTICQELVSLTDLMATCAGILRCRLPGHAAEDSYDILPYLLGTAKGPIRKDIVYASFYGNFAIQEGRWKLAFCPGSGGYRTHGKKPVAGEALPLVQLYDMESDISEKANVGASHPEVVKLLTGRMERLIQQGRSTPGRRLKNDVPVDLWKKDLILK
jgi:arylsulfatase A-like enzyme